GWYQGAETTTRDGAARTGAPEHAAGGGVTGTGRYFLTAASTTDFSCARPFSISRPIIRSMFMNRQSALATKLLRPAMLQVTAVCSPCGLNVNSEVLVPSKGFTKSTLIFTRS